MAEIAPTEFRLREDPHNEALTRPNPGRFVVFPIQHDNLWDFYKKAVASFWTVEELELGEDVGHWAKLNPGERQFLEFVLAFFAASDGIVNENLVVNFYDEVQVPEARSFYAVQICMESIHAECYSLLIDTYVKDPTRKDQLFNAIDTIPAVATKANWALRWTTPQNASFAERLVGFACVEGIFFSASFCAIFWMKKRGLMPGLCQANDLISRDEGLHQEYACELYWMLENKLPPARVVEIVVEAVDCERQFVMESLDVELIGMNSGLMTQYVEFTADLLLEMLGLPKHYNATNPFDWMDLICMAGRTNFFERRSTQYSRPGVAVEGGGGDEFSEDADF